jgi:PIG-X / PBN1
MPIAGKLGTNPFSDFPSSYVPSLDLNEWSITLCDTHRNARHYEIQVPTGYQSDVIFVEFGTAFVVVIAFFYVLRAVWKTTIRMQRHPKSKHE